jgi:ornithine cyclodeaminase
VTVPALISASDMAGTTLLLRVMDALAEAFADLSAGLVASPARTIIEHGAGQQLIVGPAIWEQRGVGCVKITTLTPGNPDLGLPLIDGVVVLTGLATGRILALLDGAELTAIRTGAVAGLATRLLASEDASELAVVGAGVQARAVTRAVFAVRPIRSVRVVSRTRASADAFADWICGTAGRPVKVTVCDTVREAVVDAEVICTATATDGQAPLVLADWVTPGAHLNVIGGTHENAIEVDPALLSGALVVVEERAAALAEAGEIRAALAAGLIGPDHLHELGALLSRPAGEGGRVTSLFRSVGMAVEDTAAAAAIFETSARLAAANKERALEHDDGLAGRFGASGFHGDDAVAGAGG